MRPVLAAVILLVVLSQSSARRFNNPILDNADYPDPGAILANGVYYVVTTTNNKSPEKFPISTSTDLNNWNTAGYAFTADNFPSWSDKDLEFWAPEIHRIGDNYHLYFSARDVSSSGLTAGVAVASSPAGPWRCLDQPLWPNGDGWDFTIANDNGNLALFWTSWTDGESIKARSLNPDGLSFSSDQITVILKPDLEWEDGMVEAPWYVRRGDYHYLFYSGHGMCSDLYRVGVARSRNIFGPYEKRGDPILASNTLFKGPGGNSIVKDLDGVNDVIVFHAWKDNQVCGDNVRLTMLASLGWGADDWPYVYDWD